MIDKKKIGAWFDKRNLWSKPFNAWTEEEFNELVTVIFNSPNHSIPSQGWAQPYINQAGELIIPMDSHPRYHWWTSNGQSILNTLKELGASQEIISRHVSNLQGVPY